MIRSVAIGITLALWAVGAMAQDSVEIGDVPNGEANLVGRIVHSEHSATVGDVKVVLYALPAQGAPGLRSTRSDSSGVFRFEGISSSPTVNYLVGARYSGVPYPGERFVFEPNAREHAVEIQVSEVTSQRNTLARVTMSLRFDWLGQEARVSATYLFTNSGNSTVYLPASRRKDLDPLLQTQLPNGAYDFSTTLGIQPEGIVKSGPQIKYFGPIYPGEQSLTFSYRLPVQTNHLRTAVHVSNEIHQIVVLTPVEGPKPEIPHLSETQHSNFHGRDYVRLEGPRPKSGLLPITFHIPPARVVMNGTPIAEISLILDLDAAALRVRENHVLSVEGSENTVAPVGGSLLDISLPTGAQSVRFATTNPGPALEVGAGGLLKLIGPLAPGETTLQVEYHLPVQENAVTLQRSFHTASPLLAVFVGDDGHLKVNAKRLHRRRPARDAGRNYLHFEAFEILEQEEINIRLSTREPRTVLPRPAFLFGIGLATIGVMFGITAPLLSRSEKEYADESQESPEESERAALLWALADLDHDFETGKIDEKNFQALRQSLTTSAPRPSDTTSNETLIEPVANRCSICGESTSENDNFCSSCGARLTSPSSEKV